MLPSELFCAARTMLDWSAQELAELAGVSVSLVFDVETLAGWHQLLLSAVRILFHYTTFCGFGAWANLYKTYTAEF